MPVALAAAVGPPSTMSAAASPIRGPSRVDSSLASAGPVGISEARPRPSPPFLRSGWVMLVALLGCCVALRELAAGVEVAHRSARTGIVIDDRHAVAGCLGDLHAARDDGPQHLGAEVPAHLLGHLVGELGAAVIHRE